MKNTFLILLVVVIVIASVYFIKQKLEAITIEFFNVKIISLTEKELNGSFTVAIAQDFGAITVLETNLKVFVNGIFLTTITQQKPVFELVNNKLQLDLFFTVDIKKTLKKTNIVQLLTNAGKNNIKIEGTARVKKIGIKATLPISYTGKI